MFGIDLQTENVAKLIQLALGPVFLLSGVGITLSMLTARLARIVDRARTLEDRREAASDAARIAHIDEDLRYIVRRTRERAPHVDMLGGWTSATPWRTSRSTMTEAWRVPSTACSATARWCSSSTPLR